MQEEYQEEFRQTGGGKWIQIIGIIVYIMIILAYALQTLGLVSWLIPGDNWFMRIITVFVCDGCATLYALAEMFYRFKLRATKNLVFGMWVITFVLSTIATVIQMYMQSVNLIPHTIDTSVTTIAYGVIIAAFIVNIVAITVIIRMEHAAGQPVQRYLDDMRVKKSLPQARMQLQQTDSVAIAVSTPDTKVTEVEKK